MKSQSHAFKTRAVAALSDATLQRALGKAKGGFVGKRAAAVAELGADFERLRTAAKEVREHTLSNLDHYLARYEEQVKAAGGHVHYASTPAELCGIVVRLCREARARRVLKGKSMVSEEAGLNEALEGAGLEVVETDLGEYIIQLAHEPPSHIIAPAVHKTKDQITELFHTHHQRYGRTERVTEVKDIVDEARTVLRDAFLNADVGITGANFLVAETGQNIIVTNEGNGDLTSTLTRVHVVTASIDKVIPTLEDVSALLRLLGRSATGQEITSYTSFYSGPRRDGDPDGPEEYHVVLLDNGRSEMLGNAFRPMLRCIRCGACMNHCPVYSAIGGHAYGWVYPGPMGSVLTPLMLGLAEAGDLPNACTLNGRCQEVCPMSIPLPEMLREHRRRQHAQALVGARARLGLAAWAFLARRPRLYQALTALGMGLLGRLGRRSGRFRSLPLAGGWTGQRDLPAPQGETFQQAWQRRSRS